MPYVQTCVLVTLLNTVVFINQGYSQNFNRLQFLSNKNIISFQSREGADSISAALLNNFLTDSLWANNQHFNTAPLVFTGKKSQAAAGVSGLIGRQKKIMPPKWSHPVLLDSVKISLIPFGTSFFIYRQQFIPDYPALIFNQFKIADSVGDLLTVDGKLQRAAGKNTRLNMKIRGSNILLMNASNVVNHQVFGKAVADADMALTGSLVRPQLQGSIYLNDATDLTFILPAASNNGASPKSIVQFIDRDSLVMIGKNPVEPVAPKARDVNKYLKESVDIRTGKNARFKILIDANSGDYLQLNGAAKVKAGIDTIGQLLLAGNFVPDSGYYELNSQFLNKRFNLLPGCRIEFNGRPAEANMNIRAAYSINTSPKNLLSNEVGVVNRAIASSFNQELPFNVILFLKGTLNSPQISFDIQLADSNESLSAPLKNSINNKLLQLRSDISGINKQVFALLAMDRFVGEQSTDFFKGNGTDLSDVSQESVSSFLTSVLDHLASDLFKGINADLNLASYQDFASSDAQQAFNVELSKSFLNDRLSVTTGKNFGIESIDGSAKAAQQKGSRFLPDVTASYKLSSDGKYLLRSYTKNQFEVILDGYVMETGLAFLVTMDYEKFKELLLKQDKKSGN